MSDAELHSVRLSTEFTLSATWPIIVKIGFTYSTMLTAGQIYIYIPTYLLFYLTHYLSNYLSVYLSIHPSFCTTDSNSTALWLASW